MIVRLDTPEARAAPVELIGGKAHGLVALIALGLPVPPAVVLPVSDTGDLGVEPAEIVRMLGGAPLAVRSSGVAEDTDERSAAGQFESVMGVTADDLLEAVVRVRRSATSNRVRAYSGDASSVAVVIQREIPASRAGVAFSRDPTTGSDEVVIECAFGHGEAIVSGAVTPDRYRVTADGTVAARLSIGAHARGLLRTLRDDEAVDLADLTRRAEDGFGRPVDVEFCFERRRLWLVQARAITTLVVGR
ncbi:MAG: PEP/pyruvate-binding domain-containing protein [Actinomycetota bacterium]